MKPRYATRCAQFCSDTRGRPRDGDQWVHFWGHTSWVCRSCAEHLAKQAGIPTAAQLRTLRDRLERKLQIHMDEAYLEVCLDEPTPAGTGATPARPG